MRIFNLSGKKKKPSQYDLGRASSSLSSFFGTGLGFDIDDFDLYSQVKDYRTGLLNGTKWIIGGGNKGSLNNLQILKLLQKYSTAIFNDYCYRGYVIFAKINNEVFYISAKNYTKSGQKITVHGFPEAEAFEFNEPNAFSGEKTIYDKCESYQKLYNIALSCQKNGMSKSGFVTLISPVTSGGVNTPSEMTDKEIIELEKRLSEGHGIANDSQQNLMIFNKEINAKTIIYDFAKLGILETKKLCEEFVCSKLGVPYVFLPSSGQTFTNYPEARSILHENHEQYCEYFTNFVQNEIGLNVSYEKKVEEKPKSNEKDLTE